MQKLQDSLVEALSIDGALGVALGDWKTGMCLGYKGTNSPAFPEANLELAVAGNTEVIRAKMRVAESLGFTGRDTYHSGDSVPPDVSTQGYTWLVFLSGPGSRERKPGPCPY